MVLGVISLVGVVTVLASACAVPLAIVGLILGFVALRRPGGRGMATAGIVMNGVVSLLSLLIVLLIGLSALIAVVAVMAGTAASP
jgi:hypothetical protein